MEGKLTSEFVQDMAVVSEFDSVMDAVRGMGTAHIDLTRFLAHFRIEKRGIRRVLRRVHIIVGSEKIEPNVRDELLSAGADLHFASGGRADCLIFDHAHHMAELVDVLALLVTDRGYLPLIRHVKQLGCRLELHALPNSDPSL